MKRHSAAGDVDSASRREHFARFDQHTGWRYHGHRQLARRIASQVENFRTAREESRKSGSVLPERAIRAAVQATPNAARQRIRLGEKKSNIQEVELRPVGVADQGKPSEIGRG